ncbi:MAG: hypothetical protein ABWZ40_01675 [Caulobacterales bacterium]
MPAQQRPLTEPEMALAERVFGSALDASRVRIVYQEHWVSKFSHFLKRGRQFVVRGDLIFCPEIEGGVPDDFCAVGPVMSGVLAHELTHVWQYQKRYLSALDYILSFNWRYVYTLRDTRRFLDYGFEQQASMVEDYVRLLLHVPPRRAEHMVNAAALRAIMPFRTEH